MTEVVQGNLGGVLTRPPSLHSLKPRAVIIDNRSAEFKGIPLSSSIFCAVHA